MTLLSTIATAWAIAMVVFGLTLIARSPVGWLEQTIGLPRTMWHLLGLASIGGGQFVFMFMVADRLCPNAGRMPGVWLAEIIIACLGLLAIVAVGAVALLGLVI
ncbi:MAG: hypothetical protein KDA31_10510 [Phycisphaerales bacterium]|nr:hypothetical protein [Phycisphaerales bacterium]MCB9836621.1 hypothetical protein [Phycisphaera sp.]